MDRMGLRNPVYVRQKSNASSVSGAPSSPMMSPMHRHVRSGSSGTTNFRRNQNQAAKAAAQRLAQVMANQQTDNDDIDDDDDDDDDLSFDYGPLNPIVSTGIASGRSNPIRPRSPAAALGRNNNEQPLSARSTSSTRPSLAVKTVAMVPPTVPITLRPSSSVAETPLDVQRETPREVRKDSYSQRDKRMSFDMDTSTMRDVGHDRSSFVLQDEVSSTGEHMPLRLSRPALKKEASQRLQEVYTKASPQMHDIRYEDNASVCLEAETGRSDATPTLGQIHETESEIRSLRAMAKRMMLTKEEMEEMVLKRCWLARYWNLCIQHDIHPEIAGPKYEFWSSLAPDPVEVVLCAGLKAKEENSIDNSDFEDRDRVICDLNDLSGEENIESMLLVEKGLRELASLKVEDAVLLAMSQHRRPNSLKAGLSNSDDVQLSNEGHFEAFELNQEESEDVLFKQAWLTYFWRRAKNHGLEQDITEERLQFWIDHETEKPTSHDAVDVERGLIELKKLGIENQLWQATRRSVDPDGMFASMQTYSAF